MSWKNYFYFQKKDKIAILVLLTLIVISGGIYIATSGSDKTVIDNSEILKKEFEEFQAGLQDANTSNFSENQIKKNILNIHLRKSFPTESRWNLIVPILPN